MGLAPTPLWSVPPSPQCNWMKLPPQHSPSLPSLPLPLSSHPPLGSFCSALEGGGPGWYGGGILKCRGGWRGEGPPSGAWGQTHIWGYLKLSHVNSLVASDRRGELSDSFKRVPEIVSKRLTASPTQQRKCSYIERFSGIGVLAHCTILKKMHFSARNHTWKATSF